MHHSQTMHNLQCMIANQIKPKTCEFTLFSITYIQLSVWCASDEKHRLKKAHSSTLSDPLQISSGSTKRAMTKRFKESLIELVKTLGSNKFFSKLNLSIIIFLD